MRFSSDGSSLTSMDRDGRVLWWDLATRKPARQFSWPARDLNWAALSPDGKTLATDGGADNELRLWDVGTSKPGTVLSKHGKFFQSNGVFSPDGRLLAWGGEDQAIHVCSVPDGKEVQQLKGVTNRLKRLRFSPDGKVLACGLESPRAELRLWDLASGKERCTFDVSETSGMGGAGFFSGWQGTGERARP